MSIFILIKFLLGIIPFLICVAFITLLERKVLSLMGIRVGPNKVSFLGILQPIMDALKLMGKQNNYLSNFSIFFYYFSSIIMFICSCIFFSLLICFPMMTSFKFSLLLFFLVLSFNSLGSIISGWSTFSKFSLIGSMRTVSQLVSYEAVLFISILFFVLFFNFFEFSLIINSSFHYFFFFFPLIFYIWVPTMLAELNRTPYDFSEGESELVSGFNTEFGSASFTLIFLAEYGNIISFCFLTSILFFFNFFLLSFFLSAFFIIWIRSVLPRFRFDKLMLLCWKFFVPFLSILFFFYFFNFWL